MRVVTFGEIMMRLAPEGYNRFVQSDRFCASYSGGEANVSVSLANLGVDSSFVTKLPTHEIGQCAVNALRRFGVDTNYIVRGGDRLGIYFIEKGASQRASKVIYDRAHSSIALAESGDFNWNTILDGADWFHFTGITPALGDNVAEICLEALKAAKAKNVTVSCDLNYRKKLWRREKAKSVMGELMKYVDVCVANEEDAGDVFGIWAKNSDALSGRIDSGAYQDVAKRLADAFGLSKIAITLRKSISASDNLWSGMLHDGKDYCFSREYPLHIVDRVGGGDSFGAGLIYSLLMNWDSQKAIEFAVAASCLKHSIEGDFNLVTVDEAAALADGEGSGRVQR